MSDWLEYEAGAADPQTETFLRQQGWAPRGIDCWSHEAWHLRRELHIKVVWVLWRDRELIGSFRTAVEVEEYRLRHQEAKG